ncbi:MAG: amylo-alpha-1,6-glucosidase [Synechococcaceae cyanobacterium]|nr:amylo-alpha-1,6-glucosidase [Synechococcaceae cyanobacterium]
MLTPTASGHGGHRQSASARLRSSRGCSHGRPAGSWGDPPAAATDFLPLPADATLRLGPDLCSDPVIAGSREWLITNGLGSYGSGTLAGGRSRSYHGLLVAALGAPSDPCRRTLLVAGLQERVLRAGPAGPLTTALGLPAGPDDGSLPACGATVAFSLEGSVPTWRFAIGDSLLEKRLWMRPGAHTTCIHYRLLQGSQPLRLQLEPLVHARCHHGGGGHPSFSIQSHPRGLRVSAAVPGVPDLLLLSDRGLAAAAPPCDWLCGLELSAERDRGLPDRDDLLRAGRITAELSPLSPTLTVVCSTEADPPLDGEWCLQERRRHEHSLLRQWQRAQPGLAAQAPAWVRSLVLAADQFVVARGGGGGPDGHSDGDGRTLLAGYPWFGDWGRDTMISLAGLTLATGRSAIAARILRTAVRHLSAGMLPNRFPDGGEPLGEHDYNTVDATLWLFEALREYLQATGDLELIRALLPQLRGIIAAHCRGTRHGIRRDPVDGLLQAGAEGVQLTWMDAKVNGVVITPRRGKPVEVNALWFCALHSLARFCELCGEPAEAYGALAEQARHGFQRFWNEASGCCFDGLDGPEGRPDASVRPNQLLAVSLSDQLLSPQQSRRLLAVCGRRLLTPMGLRSLDPADPRYRGRYGGGPLERDGAYHQGTVWAWWLGPWAVAHARLHGDPQPALRWLEAIAAQLLSGGIGSLSEIFDGDPPHAPRGCIAQAWSVAEVLRAWTLLSRQRLEQAGADPRGEPR